jgi:type IV pilus assembly protein PilC
LVMGTAVCTFLIMGIIPKFMTVFTDAGVPLPLPTQLLFQLSVVLRSYWLAIFGGLGLAVVTLWVYGRTPGGRRVYDMLVIKIPVVGELIRRTAMARFARTLETLLSSGVPVLESLEITEQTCGNVVIGDVIQKVQHNVRQGGTLHEPMQVSREFPPMVVQMVMVGETSGTLDQMLGEIAIYFDETVKYSIKRLVTLVEPAFLLVMGGMVAFIMASILLPIFKMVQVIQ